ncbi:hypothetical protein [Leptolyngbya sp. BC1307]|uniref:hypothetical protein n=1 Tax=Leptolyngbya sp. BC1307 TaxID=2029589 RepID=UPI00197F5941|nr:hypothetical protein [Leptolyngbya sp. BC1307]
MAFGFAIAPYGFSQAIALLGWRGTWLTLAAIVGIGMSSLGWLLFRDSPEACGLRMDGDPPLAPLQPGQAETAVEIWGLTRRQALKTLAFWAVTLAVALHFYLYDAGAGNGNCSDRQSRSARHANSGSGGPGH